MGIPLPQCPHPQQPTKPACLCTLEYYDVRLRQPLQIKPRIEKAGVHSQGSNSDSMEIL